MKQSKKYSYQRGATFVSILVVTGLLGLTTGGVMLATGDTVLNTAKEGNESMHASHLGTRRGTSPGGDEGIGDDECVDFDCSNDPDNLYVTVNPEEVPETPGGGGNDCFDFDCSNDPENRFVTVTGEAPEAKLIVPVTPPNRPKVSALEAWLVVYNFDDGEGVGAYASREYFDLHQETKNKTIWNRVSNGASSTYDFVVGAPSGAWNYLSTEASKTWAYVTDSDYRRRSNEMYHDQLVAAGSGIAKPFQDPERTIKVLAYAGRVALENKIEQKQEQIFKDYNLITYGTEKEKALYFGKKSGDDFIDNTKLTVELASMVTPVGLGRHVVVRGVGATAVHGTQVVRGAGVRASGSTVVAVDGKSVFVSTRATDSATFTAPQWTRDTVIYRTMNPQDIGKNGSIIPAAASGGIKADGNAGLFAAVGSNGENVAASYGNGTRVYQTTVGEVIDSGGKIAIHSQPGGAKTVVMAPAGSKDPYEYMGGNPSQATFIVNVVHDKPTTIWKPITLSDDGMRHIDNYADGPRGYGDDIPK